MLKFVVKKKFRARRMTHQELKRVLVEGRAHTAYPHH